MFCDLDLHEVPWIRIDPQPWPPRQRPIAAISQIYATLTPRKLRGDWWLSRDLDLHKVIWMRADLQRWGVREQRLLDGGSCKESLRLGAALEEAVCDEGEQELCVQHGGHVAEGDPNRSRGLPVYHIHVISTHMARLQSTRQICNNMIIKGTSLKRNAD